VSKSVSLTFFLADLCIRVLEGDDKLDHSAMDYNN
jgi:hypothetical protein